MRIVRFLAACAALALGSLTAAHAQQATPVPDVKPDFGPMKYFLGTWTCKTTQNTMSRGSGRTETDVTTMSMDGHYMETKSTSKPFDAARTKTLVGDGWAGYDTAKKQWYSFGISNFGGFGMSLTSGWSGNTMVWKDTYGTDGQPLGVTTITKVSDSKYTTKNVAKTSKGTESTSGECTKSG